MVGFELVHGLRKGAVFMKGFAMIITYSFDSDYVAFPCATQDEAQAVLEDYLAEEIETVRTESGYDPIVRRESDGSAVLIYADDEAFEEDADRAEYRTFEIPHSASRKKLSKYGIERSI